MNGDAGRRDDRTLLIVLVAVVAAVAAAFGWWRFRQALAPRLVDVVVVSRPDGAETASDGNATVSAGVPVAVSAVVGYVRGNGPTRHLCAFPHVRVGGRTVEVDAPGSWPRGYGTLRATWYTVEPALFGWSGVDAATADKLAYKDFLAPEMGSALVANLTLAAHNDDFLSEPLAGNALGAGWVRVKVRVGAYRSEDDLVAYQAVTSPGADAIWSDAVPGVLVDVRLADGVAPAVSGFLRLGCFTFAAGAWPDGGPGWPLPLTPRDAVARALIATPEAVAAAAAGDPLSPSWQTPEPLRLLAGGSLAADGAPLRWGAGCGAGDAVRAGERFAVLVRDDGDGDLSLGDLALFAWDAPARVAPLAEAFAGASEALVLLRRD